MQAGKVARVHGDFNTIPEEQFPISNDHGLKSSITIRETISNQSGDTIITGVAANEHRDNFETAEITDQGGINGELSEQRKVTTTTNFATIPGEFVVIEQSSAEFAFDLIGKVTGSMIDPINFNLSAVGSDYSGERADIWMGGFYNRDGEVNTGVAYGNNVYNDSIVGQIVREGTVNQLGLTTDRSGEEIKLMITESGYIRIYSPSEYGTPSFVRIVSDMVDEYGVDQEDVNQQ